MAAAALRGVVCFESLPDILCHRESMVLVFGGRAELERHVSPGVCHSRANMAQQARHESGRNVAVRAGGLNSEFIGVMRTLFVLLKWRGHLVAGSAESFGRGVVQTAQ